MPSSHPLDRPVWSALTTRQAHLSLGGGRAVRLSPEYGPFGAAMDASPEGLAALGALQVADADTWTLEADPVSAPPGLEVKSQAECLQMVAGRLAPQRLTISATVLTDADADQMLALARLTRPGPFAQKTHRLGRFIGVKQDGRLLAMAGERLRPEGFTEVSGVCTHPDGRGLGYGGALSLLVAERILARGETPFLHVYAGNTVAIGLYQALGFEVRRSVTATILSRPGAADPT